MTVEVGVISWYKKSSRHVTQPRRQNSKSGYSTILLHRLFAVEVASTI